MGCVCVQGGGARIKFGKGRMVAYGKKNQDATVEKNQDIFFINTLKLQLFVIKKSGQS